jgi:UDP-galactose-lipid carrier transferase
MNRIKFGFDYAVALLVLVAASPLFLLIALLIKRDGGPVFYRHKRVGPFGLPFNCLKFRTMVVDADKILQTLLKIDQAVAAEWQATQKLKNDPRITPIGHFLRRTSLDELPQLINVWRGEMSLVGPRPIVAEEMARYGNNMLFYSRMRPGLTGLWQVSGRSETSYHRRIELDVLYVTTWSLWLDLVILIKTVPAVLDRRGAI